MGRRPDQCESCMKYEDYDERIHAGLCHDCAAERIASLEAANVRLQETLVSDPVDQSDRIASLEAEVERLRELLEGAATLLEEGGMQASATALSAALTPKEDR